ncbi:tetratricopeptide repeat protein [Kitasatospora sp. NPDC101235]|uniref:tetratricopeptide repeat protein n=1 Tax=Kitasatospora sp. NPDC101235 TaxID=3364101 RepID=UPI0038281532
MLQHLISQDEHLRMVPTDRDQLAAAVEGLPEDLRALPEGADPSQARVLARWIGIGLVSLGDPDEARVFLRQALDLATASGSAGAVIATQLNLGDAYRYGGDVETADAFYRSALGAARSQRSDLVDFALQHLGKHLMEQGDLASARTCLREAQQLRTAKGDPEPVKSTQSALERVEGLLGHLPCANPASAGGTFGNGHQQP